MLNKIEGKMLATIEIGKFFGVEYVKKHLEEACECYSEEDDVNYEYFLGFEGDDETNKWMVFARVSVNRETHVVSFLDYKTPDGVRMEHPIKPTSFA